VVGHPLVPVAGFPQARMAVVVARLRQVREHCFLHQVIVLWTWCHSVTKVFALRQQ
jgi:hypothetical protein